MSSDTLGSAAAGAGAGSSSAAAPIERSATGFYPYEVLRGGVPPGVDASRKEDYLSDADFAKVFECSKVRACAGVVWALGLPSMSWLLHGSQAEFAEMKKWKQQALKKAKGLF